MPQPTSTFVRVPVFGAVEQVSNSQYRWELIDANSRKISCVLHTLRFEDPRDGENESSLPLSRDEWARAARLRVPQAKRHFIESRTFLRRTLALYLGCSAAAVAIAQEAKGKPHLDPKVHGETLSFNLSHAGRHALVGICERAHIGVDIEEFKTLSDEAQLASMVMTTDEERSYLSLTQSARQAMFFRTWTVREAYVKATGKGLHFPLNRIQVEFGSTPSERPSKFATAADGNYYLAAQFFPSCETAAAVVLGLPSK